MKASIQGNTLVLEVNAMMNVEADSPGHLQPDPAGAGRGGSGQPINGASGA